MCLRAHRRAVPRERSLTPEHTTMSVRALRALFIRKILNETGRTRYEQAMRERQRLQAATDSELAAMVFGHLGGVTPPAQAAGSTPS